MFFFKTLYKWSILKKNHSKALTLYFEQSSLTPLKYPSSGIFTPASPCIGSTMNAHVFGSLIDFYINARKTSPKLKKREYKETMLT